MQAANNPAISKRILAIVLTLGLWLVFLCRAISVFGPDNSNIFFNSDGAIPVLMANEQRPVTIFDVYYYGQDRWGAWPMLSARLIGHAMHFQWSAQSLHTMSAIWLFIGILVMASLGRRDYLAVALIFLIVLCLHTLTWLRLFDPGTVYSWQVTALLLAWYCLRQLLERRQPDRPPGSSRVKRVAWWLLTFGFSFLAIWSSFASAPFLLFLAALETWRSHLHATEKLSVKGSIRRYARGAIPVLIGIVAEVSMRTCYHRYALSHYGNEYRTLIAFDYGNLSQNLYRQLVNLEIAYWWPLILLPILAVVTLACASIYFHRRKRRQSLERLKDLIADDTFFLILGSLGIALINFVLLVSISHVRMNFYDNRYSAVTYLFGFISGLLTLFSVFKMMVRPARIRRYAVTGLLIAGVAVLAFQFPAKADGPERRRLKETATTLAERCPHCVLIGDYWDTYVFSGLQPINTMIPLPLEGQYLRTPWDREKLREAKQVIVEYRDSKLGSAESPPQFLTQYGNSLRLVDPRWYENEKYAFARYANETK
jgi:hypothetical protein